MNYRITYRVEGDVEASCMMPSHLFRGTQGCIPFPVRYVCPDCGSAWARRDVLGGGEYRAVCTNQCTVCGPGFLFRGYEPESYIRNAPVEILQRELSLIALLPEPLQYWNILTRRHRLRG